MSRMRRTLVSVVGLLATTGAAQAQTGRARWQVDAGERFCTAIRHPASDAEPTVAIRNNLYGMGVEIVIIAASSFQGKGSVALSLDEGITQVVEAQTSPRPDGRVVLQTGVVRDQTFLTGLEASQSLAVRKDDRLLIEVPLAAPATAWSAIRDCQNDALIEAGFDASAVDTVAAASGSGSPLAALGGDPIGWISYDDYPRTALRELRTGMVGALVLFRADGRVDRCVIGLSSGHADLDEATCQAVNARARIMPFAGKPKLSRLFFNWTIRP